MQEYVQPYTIEGVNITRKGDALIIKIDNPNDDVITLLHGKKPNKHLIAKEVGSGRGEVCEVLAPLESGLSYFYAKVGDIETPVFAERVLPLKGAINVRDMGGYQTSDGRTVKWGMLYRGDQLSKLEASDVVLLEQLEIKTIVDYRSTHEITLNPNKKIRSVTQTVHCDPHSAFSEAAANAVDLASENENLIKELEGGRVPKELANGSGRKIILSYESFIPSVESQRAYRKMVQALSDVKTAPSLQHCRGGKDRTGYGAMLLLMLLGVKHEDIVEDYVLTGIIRKERNAFKLSQYQELTSNQKYLDYLMSIIETRREYIDASIQRILKEYGSIEAYADEVLEIDEKQIEAMKREYLEEV